MKRIVLPFFTVCFLWTAKAISGRENDFYESSGEYDSVNPDVFTFEKLFFGVIWFSGIIIAGHLKEKKYPDNGWIVPLAWCWPFLVGIIRASFKT